MNARRLFVTSCLALITTAMVFSIRGDIVDALSADFHLTKQQMGVILSPAFWGFTLSILVGGSVAIPPGVLAITFGVLFFYYRAAGGYKALRIQADV